MKEIDYSDKAISIRITRVAQLRNLCLSLGRAGRAARDADAVKRQASLTPSTSKAGENR